MKASGHASRFRTALRSTNYSSRALLYALASLLASAMSMPALAADGPAPHRYRPGLRIAPGKPGLNEKERDAVIKTLREKSGFVELGFDESGFLMLGDRNRLSGGSQSAREMLIATMEIDHVIELESAPHSMLVTFARLGNQTIYENRKSGQKIESHTIQIDFTDFSSLQGDRQALAAFDAGHVILHELGHAVLGLQDAYDDSPGECESRVNQIRRELNQPERQHYLAKVYSSPVPYGIGRIRRAELIFRTTKKVYRLDWEASRVGQIVDEATLMGVKAKSGKALAISVAGQ